MKSVVVTDYLAQRFAHAYSQILDPERAAIAIGIGKNPDGSWDYDKADREGRRLLKSKQVLGHLRFLSARHAAKADFKLGFKEFSSLLTEMAYVTHDDFFIWEEKLGDYVVKPFFMLSKAQLMCLQDVAQYTKLVGETKHKGASSVSSIRISLVDRTKLLDMVAKINGFYDHVDHGTAEELADKLRNAAALIEATDGNSTK